MRGRLVCGPADLSGRIWVIMRSGAAPDDDRSTTVHADLAEREFVGTLLGFDDYVSLVLDDVTE